VIPADLGVVEADELPKLTATEARPRMLEPRP
jgi:hypothetical protein